MFVILAASIVVFALICERFFSLRRSQVVPAGFVDKIISELRQGRITPEVIEKVEKHSPLGQVLAAGLRNVNEPREIMRDSIEEAGRAVAHTLERFLTTIGTVATVAPLMGLFGTILGMIELFSGAQGASGGADPLQLARGISIALYNTGFGLLVAIPALIFYRHFRGLVDGFIVEMEQQAVKLVEVVHRQRSSK